MKMKEIKIGSTPNPVNNDRAQGRRASKRVEETQSRGHLWTNHWASKNSRDRNRYPRAISQSEWSKKTDMRPHRADEWDQSLNTCSVTRVTHSDCSWFVAMLSFFVALAYVRLPWLLGAWVLLWFWDWPCFGFLPLLYCFFFINFSFITLCYFFCGARCGGILYQQRIFDLLCCLLFFVGSRGTRGGVVFDRVCSSGV